MTLAPGTKLGSYTEKPALVAVEALDLVGHQTLNSLPSSMSSAEIAPVVLCRVVVRTRTEKPHTESWDSLEVVDTIGQLR